MSIESDLPFSHRVQVRGDRDAPDLEAAIEARSELEILERGSATTVPPEGGEIDPPTKEYSVLVAEAETEEEAKKIVENVLSDANVSATVVEVHPIG